MKFDFSDLLSAVPVNHSTDYGAEIPDNGALGAARFAEGASSP